MKKVNKYKSSKISQDMEKLNPYSIIHELLQSLNEHLSDSIKSMDKGNLISGSLMTCLISDWLLEKQTEIKVVHNVNVQPSIVEYLKSKGVQTIRSKVGHSYIKKIMRDNDADFGGEHSAHFYLRENFYADSGILTLLIFLKILSEKNIKSGQLIEKYEFMPSSGEINYTVEDVGISLDKIENSFEGNFD